MVPKNATCENVLTFFFISNTRWHRNALFNFFASPVFCCYAKKTGENKTFYTKVDIYGAKKICIESMNTAFSYLSISFFTQFFELSHHVL